MQLRGQGRQRAAAPLADAAAAAAAAGAAGVGMAGQLQTLPFWRGAQTCGLGTRNEWGSAEGSGNWTNSVLGCRSESRQERANLITRCGTPFGMGAEIEQPVLIINIPGKEHEE